MSDKKYATIHQHEPLRPPAGWDAQEKRFVAQLEEVLDDIYRRFGRLKASDLGGELRMTIQESAEGVKENRTAIEQTAESINLKASQESLNELTSRVETAETAIEQTAESIKLKASASTVDAILNGTTGVPKVSNSVLTIDANGIRMTGGSISLSAESSLLLSSGGKVDINGATGGIFLGEGSQVSASYGSFGTLQVGGAQFLPVIFSGVEPQGRGGCFWAQPVSVETVSATMETPADRSPPLGGFNNVYGTPDNRHSYTMRPTSEVLVGGSFDYTFTMPVYRTNEGTTTKHFYVSVSRGKYSITFPMVEITVPQYTTLWATFRLTGSLVNLFAAELLGADLVVTVWCNPTNTYNVYIQSANTATLTARVNGVTGTVQQCVLYYLPEK